jgi:hypothetical protein
MSDNTGINGIKLIDLDTLATKYRVKVSWLREQLRSRVPPQKQIPRVKIGRQVRFIEEDVDRWLKNGCRNQGAAIEILPQPQFERSNKHDRGTRRKESRSAVQGKLPQEVKREPQRCTSRSSPLTPKARG